MRPLYTKFSLLFLVFITLHLNTPRAMSWVDVASVKEITKTNETKPSIKPRTETGGRNNRPVPTKAKRAVLPITTTNKPDQEFRNFTANIEPLTPKGVKLLNTKPAPEESVGPDPFRFTLTADKDSIAIGEEIELTVAVDWVDYGVNNGVRFLPEWYKYTLKVVLPKGFTQTGGDYTDYCTKPVDANNPQAIFTIKGKLEYAPEEPKFIILRGFEGAYDKSEFIWKGERAIHILNNALIDLKLKDNHSNSDGCTKNINAFGYQVTNQKQARTSTNTFCSRNGEDYCINNLTITCIAGNKIKVAGNFVYNGSASASPKIDNLFYHVCGNCNEPGDDNVSISINRVLNKGVDFPFSFEILRSSVIRSCSSNHFDILFHDPSIPGCDIISGFSVIPIAKLNVSSTLVCPNTNFTLNASGCVNNDYEWTGFVSTNSSITTQITTNTTFEVKCKSLSCAPKATVTVTVKTIGCCTATKPLFDTPTTDCDKVTLKITNATYKADHTYKWQKSTNGTTGWSDITGATSQTYDVTVKSYYRVIASQSTCTSTSDATTEIIPPVAIALPTVTTPVRYAVGGTSLALSAIPSPSTNSLKWYDNAGTLLTSAPTPSTTTAGTTNYNVSQTNGTCESGKAQISVIVSSCGATTPTLSGSTTACSSTTLTYTSVTGHTYQWQKKNGTSWDNKTPNNGNISESGDYKLIATKTDESCSAEDTKTVTITGIPSGTSLTDISGNVSTSCSESITLSTSGCTTYYWEKAGSAQSETGASFSVGVPTINSIIKVYCGTSACHSTTFETTTVNVSSVTTPTLSAKGGTNLWTQGGTNTVKLQTAGCTVGTLKWYKGTTEVTPSIGPNEDGKITASFNSASDAGKYKVGCGCTLSNEVELIYSSLCGSQTAPTYKKAGVAVSEITGFSGTTVEIEATCDNGGAFSWNGTNQPTRKTGSFYDVAISGPQTIYNAQCAILGCILDNDLIAKSSSCDASDPTFTYNPSQSVSNGTSVTISGSCTTGTFSWTDGTAGASRTATITPTNRSFSAKCTRSSGCYNEKSADLNVGCDAPTPNFTTNPTSFPVKEGQSVTITGNCDGGSYFRWSDGAAGNTQTLYPNDDVTVGGSCISNTIANCSASNTFSVTVTKRSALTLSLTVKNAVCPTGDPCTGRINALIGNRENNNKFAYWLYRQATDGSWNPASFYSPSNTTQTSQADWNENYYFSRLTPGKYRVVVKDYFYAGNDSRDGAIVDVEVGLTVCPNGANYNLTASKYCIDKSIAGDNFSLTVVGCTGTLEWWRDNSSTDGGRILTAFSPSNVTEAGRYKALCTSSQEGCGSSENSGAFSNAIEIFESGKNIPIIVGINDNTPSNRAPDLYYKDCTSNSTGFRECLRKSIYTQAEEDGSVSEISDIRQLLGNGIAFFAYNSTNTKIPAASFLEYKLGETVTLMAAGCNSNDYVWSNGMAGSVINFTPTNNTPIIVTCKFGTCLSKPSNAITPNRTTGAFTISSNGNTVCPDNPIVTLNSTGCANELTVKWFRKQIITPEIPAVQIGTGVNLALTGALDPTFTANYYAECYSGTKLLLETKPIKITLGSELKLDEVSYNNVPQVFTPPIAPETLSNVTVNPCKSAEVTFDTKGCVGKVRWARNVQSYTTETQYTDEGYPYSVPVAEINEIVDIEGKSGFPSFTTRFTANDVIFVSCAGQNPKNNQYICSTPWQKIIVNIRQKSNAKPEFLEYKICENQPLTLNVINREVGDKSYVWKYKDAFNNAFEYNFRPNQEKVGTVLVSKTLNDPVIIPKALAEHSGDWQLDVINDCGTATTNLKIGVTHFETSINFTYTGSYKSMTFQNASTVGFKRIKKVVSTVTDPKTAGYYEVLVQDKVDTKADWTFRKVNSPTDKPIIYTFTQNRLAAAGSWDPLTYAFADPGTYEITVQIKDPATSCEVTKVETFEAKCEQPTRPTKPANADVFACLSGTSPVTFNATGCTAAGNIVNWYKIDIKDANADVTSIATGPTLSLPLTGFVDVGVFKYRAKCQYGICSSDFSDAYTLTLGKTTIPVAKAIDPKTSVESTTLVTAINTRSISLSATGCEYGNITWYRDSDNGVQATGNPIAIKFSDVNVNNTEFKFYAKCTSGTGTNTCTSDRSNLARIMFVPCPVMLAITSGALTDCGSVTLQIPAGSGDGVYKWYEISSALVKATGDKFVVTESGTYYYTTCAIDRQDVATIPFRKVVTIVKSNPSVTGPIVMGAGLATPADPVLTGSDDAPAPPSGYYTIYEWKNISVTTPVVVPGSNSTINPRTISNGGVGVYELRVKKSTSTSLSAPVPAQCIAPVLKTEVYARGAGCALDFATTNGTLIECDGQAKITVLTNQPSPLPAGAVISYRLDLNDWQTSNVITNVPYGKHTVSIRMVNGTQTCYATRDLAETLFDGCGKLSCDFRIVAKDDLGVETSTLARDPATKGLKTLKLSVESFDGSNLTNGVTYDWTLYQKGTAIKKFSSAQAEVTIGVIGTYIVKLTRSGATCTAEIAINSKPCLDTPEPTTKCETKALTGVNDEIANRLPELNVGDIVRCGDFNITIIEVSGSPAGWNGKGYVTVPYINAQVSIILKNAVFNDCYQLTNANATAELPTVFTEYDPDGWEKNIASIDYAFKGLDAIKQDLLDLFQNFENTPAYKEKIRLKLAELEDLINNASSKQLDPDVKAELQAAIDAIRNPCVPCLEENAVIRGGRVAADGNANARIAGICDIATIISTLKNLSPQQAMLKCLGGAATEVLFAYIGRWLELALDDDASKKKNFTDFSGITGSMNWSQVTLDAGVGCLQAMNPFSSGSSKLLIASVIAGEATVAFASNLMGQYDSYKVRVPSGSVKGYFDQINWSPPIVAAGTSALAGIAIEVFKTPKFKSVLEKIKKKLQSASGYSALRAKFLAIGCNDAAWGKIVKFLGGACFPAKTPIYTIHGLKPIELITVKDTVYSYDETTRKYSLNKVKQTFKKTATQLVMLYAMSGKLIAAPTPEHPFFVKGTYKPAIELVKGDSLLSKNYGYVVVEKVAVVDSVLEVYNFEVECNHNYLVGYDEIIVHNKCKNPIDYDDIDDIVDQAIKELGKEIPFEYTSYEKARNIAFKIIGTIDDTFVNEIGRLQSSYGLGKIIGRKRADNKIRWRADFDSDKGFHINVEDFRNGKGATARKYALKIVDGTEANYKQIIDNLNR